MHLNPGLPLVRRGPSALQIGVDGGLVLNGLTESDCALVSSLRTDRDPVDLVEFGRQLGVTRERVAELVDALSPVLLPGRDSSGGLRTVRLAGELDRLGAVHHQLAPLLLARRAEAVVRVDGCGALATGVVAGLAAAGIGALTAEDGPPVSAAELGSGGFGLPDLGAARAAALRRLCRSVAAETVIDVRPRARGGATARDTDLWVLTAAVALGETDIAAADQYDGAVLPVIARERDIVIGPLVEPGLTACLACRERHRVDADPAWPRIRDEATTGASVPARAGSLVSAAAALAVVQVLAWLDGQHRPASWSTELVLRLADGRVSRRPCVPHPSCLCGWAADDARQAQRDVRPPRETLPAPS